MKRKKKGRRKRRRKMMVRKRMELKMRRLRHPWANGQLKVMRMTMLTARGRED